MDVNLALEKVLAWHLHQAIVLNDLCYRTKSTFHRMPLCDQEMDRFGFVKKMSNKFHNCNFSDFCSVHGGPTYWVFDFSIGFQMIPYWFHAYIYLSYKFSISCLSIFLKQIFQMVVIHDTTRFPMVLIFEVHIASSEIPKPYQLNWHKHLITPEQKQKTILKESLQLFKRKPKEFLKKFRTINKLWIDTYTISAAKCYYSDEEIKISFAKHWN